MMHIWPIHGSGRTGVQLQMNRLSLRNNWLKLETSGEVPIILEQSIEYTQMNKAKPEDVNM
jgi:hypothetical protein